MWFFTDSIDLWLKGEFVINYNAKVFILLHNFDSLTINDGIVEERVEGFFLKSMSISLVFATLMFRKDDLQFDGLLFLKMYLIVVLKVLKFMKFKNLWNAAP